MEVVIGYVSPTNRMVLAQDPEDRRYLLLKCLNCNSEDWARTRALFRLCRSCARAQHPKRERKLPNREIGEISSSGREIIAYHPTRRDIYLMKCKCGRIQWVFGTRFNSQCKRCGNRKPKPNYDIGYMGIGGRIILEFHPTNRYAYKMQCRCGRVQWVKEAHVELACNRCSHKHAHAKVQLGQLSIDHQDPVDPCNMICVCSNGHTTSIPKRKIKKNQAKCQVCLRMIYAPDQRFSRMIKRALWVIWRAQLHGISVYQPWRDDPEIFAKYMTTLEWWDNPILQLDRIDNDKGYEPSNLRWLTKAENLLNTRISIARRKRLEEQAKARR